MTVDSSEDTAFLGLLQQANSRIAAGAQRLCRRFGIGDMVAVVSVDSAGAMHVNVLPRIEAVRRIQPEPELASILELISARPGERSMWVIAQSAELGLRVGKFFPFGRGGSDIV